jgi:hypothetical protein
MVIAIGFTVKIKICLEIFGTIDEQILVNIVLLVVDTHGYIKVETIAILFTLVVFDIIPMHCAVFSESQVSEAKKRNLFGVQSLWPKQNF